MTRLTLRVLLDPDDHFGALSHRDNLGRVVIHVVFLIFCTYSTAQQNNPGLFSKVTATQAYSNRHPIL